LLRLHSDNTLLRPRILVDPNLGLDPALRLLRTITPVREIRRKASFVGPSEARRQKIRLALRRRPLRGR